MIFVLFGDYKGRQCLGTTTAGFLEWVKMVRTPTILSKRHSVIIYSDQGFSVQPYPKQEK